MSWGSIIGQNRIKDQFRVLLRNDVLTHAYLFVGPEGVGKDAFALEIAKALQCSASEGEACGSCEDCIRAESLQHPNIHLVFALPTGRNELPEDAPLAKLSPDDLEAVRKHIRLKAGNRYHKVRIPRANGYKISSIRELRRMASLSAHGKGRKVFVLLDVEQLTPAASNALLKTLEEPLPDTMLFLTASDPGSLLPTIVSRCQVVRFDPVTADEIAAALRDREQVSPEDAKMISHLAAGSYGRALEFARSDLHEIRDGVVEVLRSIVAGRRTDIIRTVETLSADNDRHYLRQFLYLLQSWIRDAMVYKTNPDLIVNVKDADSIRKFSEGFPLLDYDRAHRLIERSISHLSRNVYILLSLTHLAIELRALIHSSRGTNERPKSESESKSESY